jgi:hypothetical protein
MLRSRAALALATCVLCSMLSLYASVATDAPEDSWHWTPFQIGMTDAPFDLSLLPAQADVRGMRINVPWGGLHTRVDGLAIGAVSGGTKVNGVALGGLVADCDGPVNGVVLGTIAAFSSTRLNGASFGGLVSECEGEIHGVNLGGMFAMCSNDLSGVAIGGLTTYCAGQVNGVTLAGLAAISSNHLMNGVALAGLLAYSHGMVDGISFAGGVSGAGGGVNGINFGAIAAVSSRHMNGVSAGGLTSYCKGNVHGLIAGGLGAGAQNVKGAVFSGFVTWVVGHLTGFAAAPWNEANHVNGCQIGLYNHCRQGGVQIGILNWNESSAYPWLPFFNMGE